MYAPAPDPSGKAMVRIQSAQGWSMGSKGERSLPLVMGCWGAGTLPDW